MAALGKTQFCHVVSTGRRFGKQRRVPDSRRASGDEKEDFHLEVKDGTLTLTGERQSEKATDGVEYRTVERVNGKFWRSFSLPETVKHDGIQATYKDGILEIRVPKAEEAKPRQIEISVH